MHSINSQQEAVAASRSAGFSKSKAALYTDDRQTNLNVTMQVLEENLVDRRGRQITLLIIVVVITFLIVVLLSAVIFTANLCFSFCLDFGSRLVTSSATVIRG
ncbi:unnamed protein product [Soboliphyme baturini]|uniref:Transmembrane protein n=1 Tax=Soboliphyme baturini TaxID=241478 RepID=A0A183J731_9BILA|nr:unnamed protein product [Soboliphyme baturini]